MKIFISWSGDLSHEVAKLFNEWLPCVLQATEPWLSDNIKRGNIWFNDVTNALNDCSIGIICLTKSNIYSPWILFESGGLLKSLTSSNKICTFLVNLEPKDIELPLAEFNHTMPNREGVYSLLSTINDELDNGKLNSNTLDNVFELWWPKFEQKFSKIISNIKEDLTPGSTRNINDILEEILYHVRPYSKDDVLKSTGVVRKVDDLGRITIPREIRKIRDMLEGDSVEVLLGEDSISLRKYNNHI